MISAELGSVLSSWFRAQSQMPFGLFTVDNHRQSLTTRSFNHIFSEHSNCMAMDKLKLHDTN